METGRLDVDDLCALRILDGKTILYSLETRYKQDIIYTYIGDVLVAVNPFKEVPLYGEEHHALFDENVDRTQHSPHIFWVAQNAYRRMKLNGRRQCVLVSGESGAGKTESTKLMIKHITYLCSEGVVDINERINKVNPLLEAFGNAKTVMNDNSSRFGKYVEVFFSPEGDIVGGKITDYMLEKSRVVKQGDKEQNFHIFYTLLRGMPVERRMKYHLGDMGDYRIMNSGTRNPPRQKPIDYVARFQECESMLREVGFNDECVENVFLMLAAVLHLTNVKFTSEDIKDKNSSAKIADITPLEHACEALSKDVESLAEALVSTTMFLGGEAIVTHKNIEKASDGRDALAKWLYERLFGWVVKQINEELESKVVDQEEIKHSIGILDISGFENFRVNSFEQLCINVANEKLQSYFNEHIFGLEQKDYESEGINWKHIDYQNNQKVLELFEQSRFTILSLLDEESRLIPLGSSKSFVTKCNENFSSNRCYVKVDQNLFPQFGIQHYADKVIYNAVDFIEKNRDTLQQNLIDCMRDSDNLLISDLFKAELSSTGSVSRTKSQIRRGMSVRSPGRRRGPGVADNKNKNLCQKSIAFYFKNSLEELISKMKVAEPFFVRCLKPNHQLQENTFDHRKIEDQLKSNGILEICHIRKRGYPVRITMEEFASKYSILSKKRKDTPKAVCESILKGIRKEDYAVGRTKIFMKLHVTDILDKELRRMTNAALTIQKWTRGHLGRQMVQKLRKKLEEDRRRREEEKKKKEQEEEERKRKKLEEEKKRKEEEEERKRQDKLMMEEQNKQRQEEENKFDKEQQKKILAEELNSFKMPTEGPVSHINSRDEIIYDTIQGEQVFLTTVSMAKPHEYRRLSRLETQDELFINREFAAGGSMKQQSIPEEEESMSSEQSQIRSQWDRFGARDREDGGPSRAYEISLRVIKGLLYLLLFIFLLIFACANRATVLWMTSAMPYINKDGHWINETLIQRKGEGASDQELKVLRASLSSVRNTLFTFVTLCITIPYFFTFLTYIFKALFGSAKWPSYKMMLSILLIEAAHTFGLCLMVFKILPNLDVFQGLLIVNAVFTLPALFKIFLSSTSKNTTQGRGPKMATKVFDVLAFIGQISAPVVIVLAMVVEGVEIGHFQKLYQKDKNLVWEIPVSLILLSTVWWENYIERQLVCVRALLHSMRQKTTVVISMWKIGLTFLFGYALTGYDYDVNIISLHIRLHGQVETNTTTDDDIPVEQYFVELSPFLAQIIVALLGCMLSKLACKLCMQHFGFSLPLLLVTPVCAAVVLFNAGLGGFLPQKIEFMNENTTIYTMKYPNKLPSEIPDVIMVVLGVVWYLSMLWVVSHIWMPSSNRFAKEESLFVSPMYCGTLLEQWMMANRRRNDGEQFLKIKPQMLYNIVKHHQVANTDEEELQKGFDKSVLKDDTFDEDVYPMIYACATMWHETTFEMTQLLKSVFRMDFDQGVRRVARENFKVKDPDYYEFECHILFDDSWKKNEKGEWIPNDYVIQMINVMNDAASAVIGQDHILKPPVKVTTPYGGRLVWTLPGGTKLIAHLKNKHKIRHRKRWSQVMYMYYLLGYKPMEEEEMCMSGEGGRRLSKAHYLYNQQQKADNTFLLALDGDVDFHPDAVRLLVDKMKKNPKVGAVCGRIHPIGSGPLVWYQVFEYAIGHWLQKATEHVLGCVLCSPGCFSLFRGSSLMDDNVMKKYTEEPTEPRHYVQYDQGEDRWLCTLLLQQGYRVDYVAASDALTYAPEDFKEFYNQRRRWMPSTLANIMDLLQDYKGTVKQNDNISFIYIVYQFVLMVTTVLGPATVALMIASCFESLFPGIGVIWSNVAASGPMVIYIIICFKTKQSTQLNIAALLSTLYALVMMAVLVGSVVKAVENGLLNPPVIFLVGMVSFFLIAGLLHPKEMFCLIPGFLYFLCIPSGYLLLVIYSLCNLNVVSWGTREAPKVKTPEELKQEAEEAAAEAARKRKKGGIMSIFKGDIVAEIKDLFKNKESAFQISLTHMLNRLDKNVQKLLKANKAKGLKDIEQLSDSDDSDENVDPKPKGFDRKKTTVRAKSIKGLQVIAEDDDDDDKPDEIQIDTAWMSLSSLGKGKSVPIKLQEDSFWKNFIEKYLKPLDQNKEKQKKLSHELKELRNNINFAFWMLNAVWMVLNIMLSLSKQWLTVNIGKEEVEIFSFVFLSLFGLIMSLQFVGMLIHRWGTFVHLMAFTTLDILPKKSYVLGSQGEEGEVGKMDLKQALEITKEIIKDELLEEPEPDYSDTETDSEEGYGSLPGEPEANGLTGADIDQQFPLPIEKGPKLLRRATTKHFDKHGWPSNARPTRPFSDVANIQRRPLPPAPVDPNELRVMDGKQRWARKFTVLLRDELDKEAKSKSSNPNRGGQRFAKQNQRVNSRRSRRQLVPRYDDNKESNMIQRAFQRRMSRYCNSADDQDVFFRQEGQPGPARRLRRVQMAPSTKFNDGWDDDVQNTIVKKLEY